MGGADITSSETLAAETNESPKCKNRFSSPDSFRSYCKGGVQLILKLVHRQAMHPSGNGGLCPVPATDKYKLQKVSSGGQQAVFVLFRSGKPP
jgi:hypothetical protein